MSFLALLNASAALMTTGLEALRDEDASLTSQAWASSGFYRDRAVYFGRRGVSVKDDAVHWQHALEGARRSQTKVIIACLSPVSHPTSSVGDIPPFLWQEWILAQVPGGFIPKSIPLVDATPQGSSESERWLLYLLGQVRYAANPTEALKDSLDKAFRLGAQPAAFLLSNGQRVWGYSSEGSGNEIYKAQLPDGAIAISTVKLGSLASVWKPTPPKTLFMAYDAGLIERPLTS